MDKEQPDRWVRRAIMAATASLEYDGENVPVFDMRAPVSSPQLYVLMSTQNLEEFRNKTAYYWGYTLLLEVVHRRTNAGNVASRIPAEETYQALRLAINDLELDALSGLKIITQVYSYPADLQETTASEIVTRKFLRLSLKIS